jgi:hypothetical protein
MTCNECVFYSRRQQQLSNTPCISCTSDLTDKGYCVAVNSEIGLVPVVTKIFDEGHARAIIARGSRNGSRFQLLHWSNEINAYQPT